MTTVRALIAAISVLALFGVAVAKLPPAPPLTEEQKAEKAAKDKATADTAKAQLTRAEDRAVANYIANQKAKGIAVNPQMPPGAPPAAAAQPAAATAAAASAARPDSGGGKGLPAQPEKASNAHSPPKK